MQIGNYKLTHHLGAGGMGTVYKALDSSGNPVALKMIGSKALIDATIHVKAGRRAQQAQALDPNVRMMFVREARLAMELDHPNITRVFDYGQHEGLLYIVMEYLNGRALDKVIPLHAGIALSTRIALIRQLCDALGYAHGRGVIHRDIKPPNCFVVESTALKVLDFGIAMRADQQTVQASPVGTYPYMAPELFGGPPRYTESVDIWAAGVTLYQLLTGRLPFTGLSIIELGKNITQKPFQALSESLPCATELGMILDRALAKDPAYRYAAAYDFARDLESVEAVLDTGRESPDEGKGQSGAPVWWARSKAQETALTSPLPASGGPKIALVKGEIWARRGGHAVRFAEYNERILRPVLLGMIFAVSYAIFSMLGGNGFSSLLRWAWTIAAFASSLLIPVLFIISAFLGGLVFIEKFFAAPRCRRCNAFLRHRSSVTAFAYSKVSWRHASTDCLAALKENLWDDASKLLSMHGELVAPAFDYKTSYPPLRLHLDFYSCRCGDEMAVLTTEDRIGWTWSTREEFRGAYKTTDNPARRQSIIDRLAGTFKAAARAARLAAEPVSPGLACILIAATLLIGLEYWPQFPIIQGKKGFYTEIVIQSDPPGQVCQAYDSQFFTPHTFLWAYRSVHTVVCDEVLFENGKIYHFSGVTPKPLSISTDRWLHGSHDVAVQVDVLKDRWGRLTTKAATPVYTVRYVATGKYDIGAGGRAESKAEAARKAEDARNPGNYLPQGVGAANQVKIAVNTNPPGLAVLVDGIRVVAPKSYVWQVGSYHTMAIPPGRQELSGANAAAIHVYSGGRWDYGIGDIPGGVRINWSAIPFPLTYTATFRAAPASESRSSPLPADK